MKTYSNNDSAPYGLYIGSPLDLTFVSSEGELLEGRNDTIYRRVPTLLSILLSPIIGGTFVLLFPALVISTVFYALLYFISKPIKKLASKNIHMIFPNYSPTTSYFARPSKNDSEEHVESEENIDP